MLYAIVAVAIVFDAMIPSFILFGAGHEKERTLYIRGKKTTPILSPPVRTGAVNTRRPLEWAPDGGPKVGPFRRRRLWSYRVGKM